MGAIKNEYVHAVISSWVTTHTPAVQSTSPGCGGSPWAPSGLYWGFLLPGPRAHHKGSTSAMGQGSGQTVRILRDAQRDVHVCGHSTPHRGSYGWHWAVECPQRYYSPYQSSGQRKASWVHSSTLRCFSLNEELPPKRTPAKECPSIE